jgi:hypothetical protein
MSLFVVLGLYFFSSGSIKAEAWPAAFKTLSECQAFVAGSTLDPLRDKLEALDAVLGYGLDCVEVPISTDSARVKPEPPVETPKTRQEKLPKLTT